MTFLAQSEVPGLQVRMPDGRWVDVPYVPGSFAVNSGDMMQRWTNHRFKSTPHRALPPVARPRYAIPYFMGPHLDTEIACLSTCQGPGNPPRYRAHHLRGVPRLVVRRQLQRRAPARRGLD